MSVRSDAPPPGGDRRSSLDRMLDILTLFDESHPVWTVDGMLKRLGYSRATAYRYVRSLCRISLLDPVSGGGYVLGPAVLEWEHLVRSADPLLAAAHPVLERIRALTGETVVLARPYRDRVLCTAVTPGLSGLPTSLDRGRPLPRFRGAASKAILAHLGGRRLRSLWELEADGFRDAGLGDDLNQVRDTVHGIRYQGHVETHGELAPGVADCAAPVVNADGAVLGSLCLVRSPDRSPSSSRPPPFGPMDDDVLSPPGDYVVAVVEGAAEVTRALREGPLGAPSRIGTGPPAARLADPSDLAPH